MRRRFITFPVHSRWIFTVPRSANGHLAVNSPRVVNIHQWMCSPNAPKVMVIFWDRREWLCSILLNVWLQWMVNRTLNHSGSFKWQSRPHKQQNAIQLHHDNAVTHFHDNDSLLPKWDSNWCHVRPTAQVWLPQTSTCLVNKEYSEGTVLRWHRCEVKDVTRDWVQECPRKFVRRGFQEWVHWWHKCLSNGGYYYE